METKKITAILYQNWYFTFSLNIFVVIKKTRDEKPNQLHHWTINRRPLCCWLSIGLKKVV